jgi:integrase
VRFLAVDESKRLVNACDEVFRQLVRGALFSGCWYAELAKVKVMDLDAANGSLRVDGKGRDTAVRHVSLTAEGEAFFKDLAAGRPGSELLFRRGEVGRTTRKDAANAAGWLKGDAKTPMWLACKAAGIEPMTFHGLRHTYASELVRRGVPLMMVAQQLGHRDTRMVEMHYGHLQLARRSRRGTGKAALGRPDP